VLGPNAKKWHLYRYIIGTKGEKLNFYSSKYSKFTFSTAFGPGTMTARTRRKKFKKSFFGYLYRSKYLIFGPKKFLKNFLAAFGTWYYLQKKF
jgi:hypothetical protein